MGHLTPLSVALLSVIFYISMVDGRVRSDRAFENFLKTKTQSPQDVICCPPDDELLCLPLEVAKRRAPSAPHVQKYIEKSNKAEVFAFVVQCNSTVWTKFDWTKLTTIALSGFLDDDLTRHAHQNGVKVVKLALISTSKLTDPTARKEWIDEQTSEAVSRGLDGTNIDYESAIEDRSPEQAGLSSLVQETVKAFHDVVPGSEVSFDVPWNSGGVDGRYYDYKAIGNYSDLLFIMAYDEQSQIFDKPCDARPNSGIYNAATGIDSYTTLGIPAEKLILGVPWYGYNYECISLASNETCYIEEVPFRGANCSDAAGSQHPYDYMLSTMKQYNATYRWDEPSLTPYYTFKDAEGQYRQMRYDDETSLAYKYMLAIASSLRGVGMWTANFLDYSDTPEALEQQRVMWGTLP